jgi:hypothetical protein
MKKLMTGLLALAFLTGTVAVAQEKKDDKKAAKKKTSKKKKNVEAPKK